MKGFEQSFKGHSCVGCSIFMVNMLVSAQGVEVTLDPAPFIFSPSLGRKAPTTPLPLARHFEEEQNQETGPSGAPDPPTQSSGTWSPELGWEGVRRRLRS